MALLPLGDMTHTGQLRTRPQLRPETASSFCLQPPGARHYDTTHSCAQTRLVGRSQMASLRIPTRDSETVAERGYVESHIVIQQTVTGRLHCSEAQKARSEPDTARVFEELTLNMKQTQGKKGQNPPHQEERSRAGTVPACLILALGTFFSRDSQGP